MINGVVVDLHFVRSSLAVQLHSAQQNITHKLLVKNSNFIYLLKYKKNILFWD